MGWSETGLRRPDRTPQGRCKALYLVRSYRTEKGRGGEPTNPCIGGGVGDPPLTD